MAGSYQFIHLDSYAREGSERATTITKKNGDKVTTTTKVRSVKEILEEQARIEGACPHIQSPRHPGLLYGVQPLLVLPLIEEWAAQATDSRGHKLRKDGLCAVIGVVSLPRDMEDDFPKFAEATLLWLKAKYKDRLKSVVVHDDEAHPHLHFTVVPRMGERFEDIHEGYKASKQAKANGKKKGEQNLAYTEAMRGLQDDFSQKVATAHGLTRIGPSRRRLTRAQWHKEKQQAQYFANAKKVAQVHAKKGYREGRAKAEQEAQHMIEEAQKQATGWGKKVAAVFAGMVGGWHEPTAQVQAEIERVRAESESMQKEAQDAQNKAKEWADRRVAEVANQITLEKAKNAQLEKELDAAQKQSEQLDEQLALCQKRFTNVPVYKPKTW